VREITDSKYKGMSYFDILHQAVRNGTVDEFNTFRDTSVMIRMCRQNSGESIYRRYGKNRMINWMEMELNFMMKKIKLKHC